MVEKFYCYGNTSRKKDENWRKVKDEMGEEVGEGRVKCDLGWDNMFDEKPEIEYKTKKLRSTYIMECKTPVETSVVIKVIVLVLIFYWDEQIMLKIEKFSKLLMS